jgi:hypothetical protein
MTTTDASARVAPLTAKRESSPVDVKAPSTRSPKDQSRHFIKPLLKSHRHPEALQRPTDQTGVATFDVVVDGRE